MNSLREQLCRDEGVKLTAYQDTLGYWTIGVGHWLGPASETKWKGYKITQQQCDLMLDGDIAKHTALLTTKLPWVCSLDQVRQEVLINMYFNMGDKLLQFVNTLGMFKAKNFEGAAANMLKSKWAEQVKGRATRLSVQTRTGIRQ